ncbi:alpha/beta hydrolase family protein [Nocardia sp. BMG111209]|uniref:alpha/beta hydrolase n=1 Tax=Nocardia sp. BMG111209 TaxID=1160137 RepID=UPI00037D6ABB|nr:alpha/beta hydrolase family protein [Nocardia sp. BMG111209]
MHWGLACALLAATGMAVTSAPVTAAPDTAGVVSAEPAGDRQEMVTVFSPAMNKTVPIQVLHAADPAPRPTLYLLNGSQGGPNESGWDAQTDALDFLRGQDVNVVNPIGGSSSYYTDWLRDDPVLGRNKWQTFLDDELPPIIEEYLHADGKRAAAGVSMSGTSVLNLAIAKPGFWNSVASYSGCAQTSDPVGHEFVRITVENWGGASSVENMWGPADSPVWRANDPLLHAEQLRGTAIYLSAGNGVPAAPHDTPADRRVQEGRIPLPVQIAFGGPIEAAIHYCTVNLTDRLHSLNIPVTVDDRPDGTHSWGYWEDELHRSWPFLARAIGSRTN